MESLMLLENPYYRPRRKRRGKGRKNPMARALALPGTFREWTQGVDLMDAGAAVGGLAAATMLPGMLVRDTSTMGRKFMKLLVSLGAAMGAGALGKAMISASAGKAAIIGGIAGTSAQALGMFTTIKIGQPGGRRIGETFNVPSSQEQVQMIVP